MPLKILVPLDGSRRAEHALPYALALARAAQGMLILLRARADSRLQGQAEHELVATVNRLQAAGIAIEPWVISAVPRAQVGRAIAESAQARHADLIVMAAPGRGGPEHWAADSITEQVIRRAAMPVLLITPDGERRWPEDRALRWLMPLDEAGLAEAAVEPVSRLAATLRAELYLLWLVEHPHVADPNHYPSCAFNPDAELAEAQCYLKRLADRLRATNPATLVRTSLSAVTTTPCVCQTGMDLVALVPRRGDTLDLVLGDVVGRMFPSEGVPLLIVRPETARPSVAERDVAQSSRPSSRSGLPS